MIAGGRALDDGRGAASDRCAPQGNVGKCVEQPHSVHKNGGEFGNADGGFQVGIAKDGRDREQLDDIARVRRRRDALNESQLNVVRRVANIARLKAMQKAPSRMSAIANEQIRRAGAVRQRAAYRERSGGSSGLPM